jgi:hypothetical protein
VESINQYREKFKEIDIGLYQKDEELQEKIIDELVEGFTTKVDFSQAYKYEYYNETYKTFFRLKNPSASFDFSLDFAPFGSIESDPGSKKRMAKILILLWYSALIKNEKKSLDNEIFKTFVNGSGGSINYITNKKNFGFNNKIFGNNIKLDQYGPFYFAKVSLMNFFNSEDRVRELLSQYLFEETKFCGKMMPITKQELEIIQKHC